MNTQSFYYGDGHFFSDEEIMAQNLERMKRGAALDIGHFEVYDTEVRYYYSVQDTEAYLVTSLVGAAREGNDFDSFVLTAENGTEFVAYVYGISALDRTEEELCRIFHDAVKQRKTQKGE